MNRYIERDWSGKIISSFEQQQPNKRLNTIDSESKEYKEWEKTLEQETPNGDRRISI
jgi:hypothetical protein